MLAQRLTCWDFSWTGRLKNSINQQQEESYSVNFHVIMYEVLSFSNLFVKYNLSYGWRLDEWWAQLELDDNNFLLKLTVLSSISVPFDPSCLLHSKLKLLLTYGLWSRNFTHNRLCLLRRARVIHRHCSPQMKLRRPVYRSPTIGKTILQVFKKLS